MPEDRSALGAFLRARRDALTPAQAGMRAFPGPRRVPGLRREELAVLAGLSPDYYSRLEQGRQLNVSDEVLDALARALRLDRTEHDHLRDLAAPRSRRRAVADLPQRPDPGLLRVLAAMEHLPALLLGHRGDVLARNALLPVVLGRPLTPGTSFYGYLFTDPLARERIVNWEVFASSAVAGLRRELGRRPYDARLRALVQELRAHDADVDRWWTDHQVRDHSSTVKRIAHPSAGELVFDVEVLVAPHEQDQVLVLYTAPAGSPTARLLPILSSWDADVLT